MTGLMAKVAAYSKSRGEPPAAAYKSMGIMPSAARGLVELAQANIVLPTDILFARELLSIEDVQFRKEDLVRTNAEAIEILDKRQPFVAGDREALICRAEDQGVLEGRQMLNVEGLDRKDVPIILAEMEGLRTNFRVIQAIPGGIKLSRSVQVHSAAKVQIEALGSTKVSSKDARSVELTVIYNGHIIYSDPVIVRGEI